MALYPPRRPKIDVAHALVSGMKVCPLLRQCPNAPYHALAEHGEVPHSTLHHRARGRRSMEENALVKFILHMSDVGQPVRIKHISFLAFVATRQRPAPDRPFIPPGKKWAKAFERRHPETAARRVMALDWNCHEKNIARKITHWLEVIGRALHNPAILPENVYNMDETGVMLQK